MGMKIYKKVVINLQGKVIEEDSYEYTGPIAECGSGGGGSSGKSDWPDYMKGKHEIWLNDMDALIPTTNPYTGVVAYDPATVLADLATNLSNFTAFYTSIGNTLSSLKSVWSGWLTTVATDLNAAMVAALEISGIPEFEAGMRDINAVQTSSFTLGKAMLYARVGLEASKLALLNAGSAMDMTMKYGEALKGQLAMQIDYSKVVIIALKEQKDRQVDLDAEEAKWPFFEFREAGALLGAIGGSAAMQGPGKPSQAVSALGGAMAGAATGAALGTGTVVGAGWGTAIGAVVGGVAGYLSAS